MTQPFLVTGLPRSRTGWFSVAASMMGNAICHHEPIRDYKRWQDCLALWTSKNYAYTGISDHSLGFHLPEILSEYRPNTLVIHRNQAAVYSSLRSIGVHAPGYLETLTRRIGTCLRNPLVMQVDFDQLTDPCILMDCLEWLMPGARPDMRKAEMMVRMNVQADMDMIRADVARAGGVDDILGADVVAEIRAS